MLLEVGVCQHTVQAWRLVGLFVLIIKIVVPLIIIITATVPIFNALMKGTADELIGSAKKIFFKLFAGIIIFFIPTIIETSVKLLVNYTDNSDDTMICANCFANPNGSECAQAMDDYNIIMNGGTPEKKSTRKKEPEIDADEEAHIGGGALDTGELDDVSE